MKAFSVIANIHVDLRFRLYVREVAVEVGGLFTSRDKQINPLGSKLWSASRSRFYLARAQYFATLWSMDEKKKSVTGDSTCVIFQNQYSVYCIISTAKSVYCIFYCKLFVSHSVKICRRENASPQSVVSSQQDKMVIKEDLAKSRVSRLRLN